MFDSKYMFRGQMHMEIFPAHATVQDLVVAPGGGASPYLLFCLLTLVAPNIGDSKTRITLCCTKW